MTIAPYLQVVRVYARAERANTRRIVAATLLTIARVGLIAAIYRVAYSAAGTGTTALPYANAVWSIGIYFAFIINLGLRHVFTIANREVNSGDVEVSLVRPLDWRLTKICQLFGQTGLEFLVQLAVLPLALLLFVGPPTVDHLSPGLLLGFVVLTLLAMITAAALFLTIGLAAFWLTDAQSLFRLVDKLIMVFGGAFVPIALLPQTVQFFVRYSPFGVYAAPTQLFNPSLATHFTGTLISAIAWAGLLLGLCQIVWRAAQRQIEVNGG